MLRLGQMQGPHLDREWRLALVMGDAQAVLLHLLDMRRPHVDQGHILAGAGHVGSGVAADRSDPDHRDPLAHHSSPEIASGPCGPARADPNARSDTVRAALAYLWDCVLYRQL